MTSHGTPNHRLAGLVALAMLLALGALTPAQQVQSQQQDEEFARLVREWTTRPEFLSPLVDHLPRAAVVPSPKDVLGHHVGAPNKLSYYSEILGYYRALAAKSPRVKFTTIGKTDEGRDLAVVFIGAEESIKNLEQNRLWLGQLADPRSLSDAQARDIIAKAKPIYHLMGGLHSAETGPPEMFMELAYRLVVEETPLVKQIRDNVIVAITPVAEPDGRDRYVDWYYAYKVNEKGEDDSMGGPPYWGKYVYHDNNRDINYSQVTMRALLTWYLQWHPPIMHDLHESVPFLYTFSGQPPQNPARDPILYSEMPWFAQFEVAQMVKYGMPGVWTHAFVDMWSPGYLGIMAANHNGILRMYEVFGNGGANTMKRRVDRTEGPIAGGQTTREWYRPLPPYREVEWSIRNNVNYGETGVLSGLQLTSAFPKVVLENYYLKSRHSIDAGKNAAPYAYVISAGQRDMTRVAFVLNILTIQGIEVGRARSEVKLKEGTFPAGSFIVKLDQPFGRYAKMLFEKQDFPDPNLRTYDDTAWTLGLMTESEIKEIGDKDVLDVAVDPVTDYRPVGTVTGAGAGGYVVVAANGSANLITLRYRLKDLKVRAIEKSFKADDVDIPAGSFVIARNQGGSDASGRIRAAVEQLGLTAAMAAAEPDAPMHDVDLPRLAIYSIWGGTQEVGWVRHAFDQYEVPFDLIYKERVRKGALRESYDVIVMPSQGGSGKRIVFDIEPKRIPLVYKATEKFKSLGMYGESDDITGGMGLAGVVEFQKFVDAGGVLVTLGGASFFPTEFGITRRVDASRPSAQFYAPGPVVEAEILQPQNPIFYGYTQKTVPIRYANGPLLRVPDEDKPQVLMQLPGGDRSVLSGLMKGASEIRNRPAILDVPTGKGRVLIFATNPCYRWQNLGEFNMLFNSILHYNDAGTTK